MPCTRSSHAQHKFIRGCCQGSCACGNTSSYAAEPYNPCCGGDAGFGNNLYYTFDEVACGLITDGLTGTTFSGLTGLSAALGVVDFSSLTCAPLQIDIRAGTTGTALEFGSITNGAFTVVSPLPTFTVPQGNVNVILDNTQAATPCKIVTLT